MKKKICILIISILFPLILVSQKDSSTYKWDIIAGGGMGLPEGPFLNITNAYKGGTAFISASEKIKNSIYDLVVMTSYNSNNFNLGESLKNSNEGIMGVTYEDAQSYGSYQESCALIGFAIAIPKNSSGFSFNLRLMTGAVYSYSPRETYYTITYTYPTPVKDYVTINTSNKLAVPLDIGIDFKIPLPKKLLLFFGWDCSTLELINYTGGIGYRF